MSTDRVIVSTPVEPKVLAKLDAFCEDTKQTRADVMRGLLSGLLDGRQAASTEDVVLSALKQIAPRWVRAGRVVQMVRGKASRASVFRALKNLVDSGQFETMDAARDFGRPYKVYRASLKQAPPCV